MKRIYLFLLTIALFSFACSEMNAAQSNDPKTSPSQVPGFLETTSSGSIGGESSARPSSDLIPPPSPIQTEGESSTPLNYPANPESVVVSFLSDYQGNPGNMEKYLSANRLSALPEGEINSLLGFSGQLDGFIIQSAAVSPDPPAAILGVGLVVDGNTLIRDFYLVFEENRWVIDQIQAPPE